MWKKWKERFFALVQVFFSCGFRSFNHLLITKYRLLLPFGCVVKNIFESVDETLKCDHSNESYWAVLSCGTVYYAVQGGSNFWVLCCIRWFYLFSLWMKAWSVTIQMKATEQYYTVVLVIMLYKGGSNFWVCGWNPSVWPFKWKLTEQFFPVVLFSMHHLIHLKINKIFFYLCRIYFIFRSAITHLQCAVIVKSKLNQQKWWN